MVCINCGGQTKVVNSRRGRQHNQVWRRRQCEGCGSVFSSVEMPQYELAWSVISPKRSITPFSRDKLLLSLYRSCAHRSNALGDARGLADTIISKLPGYLSRGTIKSVDIAKVTQVALNRFDKAASVHYQAFHSG